MNIMAAAKISEINPPYNASVQLGENITLNIAYDTTVSLSARNITIYQIDGENLCRHNTAQDNWYANLNLSSQVRLLKFFFK